MCVGSVNPQRLLGNKGFSGFEEAWLTSASASGPGVPFPLLGIFSVALPSPALAPPYPSGLSYLGHTSHLC